jgi:hypothetical protein
MTSRNSESRRSNRSELTIILPAALGACVGLATAAWADPLPGEQLKFYQSPLNGGAPGVYPVGAVPLASDTPARFLGHDELSTATLSQTGGGLTGTMMADDFLDTNPNPIGHITFWGSYMNGTDPGPTGTGIQTFDVLLFSDVPAIGTPGSPNFVPSHPGTLLASQLISAGALSPSSGTFTQKLIPPNSPGAMQPGDSPLYEYNAELNWRQQPFPDAFAGNTANPDPIEWLGIVAFGSTAAGGANLAWGWHDRDYGIADPLAAPGFDSPSPFHGGDDAVSGTYSLTSNVVTGNYVAQNYLSQYDGIGTSKDLAFALYTTPSVPEPATLSLLALAAPALLVRRRRKA